MVTNDTWQCVFGCFFMWEASSPLSMQARFHGDLS
jgi:hypothetical protein